MARHGEEDPYGLNEVDAFSAAREKVLLEEAGLDRHHHSDGSDFEDEQDEEVFGSESDSQDDESEQDDDNEDEDPELDGEAVYKKVFGRNLDKGGDEEEEEDNDVWGGKQDYYGADDLDDDETAREIEKEALRQQKKHLEDLQMQDYLDDDLEQEWAKDAKEFDLGEFQQTQVTELSVKDILQGDSESKLKFIQTSFPEFIPLTKELGKLKPVLEELKTKEGEVVEIKRSALSSYLGTVASYFAVFLHQLKTNDDVFSMREHDVMESILTTKEVWRQASLLDEDIEMEQESDEEEVDHVDELDEEMLEDVSDIDGAVEMEEGASEGESDEESDEEEMGIDINKSRVQKHVAVNDNDYVEDAIADVDAQEKKNRRRTLRFYTSKIDQQASKKDQKFAGDEDLPYKERLFERQQRLLEEARKRGMEKGDLDDEDFDSGDEAAAKEINDDFYNSVAEAGAAKKSARRDAHEQAVQAAKEGKLAELAEELGANGKRAVNYQILKNKGLTPHRKKENRNARVKKRKKYEQAQKKLKSVRAVYSGGQSGAYEGEKTGIKKNLSKSVKF